MSTPPPDPLAEHIRQTVTANVELTPDEVNALVATYSALARSVRGFPEAELRRVEPPLRSVPR
jgi:hypothetical protein